jgi:ParB-like chromosome segregation protein Spo0J
MPEIAVRTPEVQMLDLDDLKEFEDNPQEHEVEAIKQSIREVGFVGAILTDSSGKIIDGHGRKTALLELRDEGYEVKGGKIPVLTGEFSPVEARLLLVATDRLRGFPDPVRMGEFLQISADDFGLSAEDFEWTGLTSKEIDDHLALLASPEDLQNELRELGGRDNGDAEDFDGETHTLPIKFTSEQLEFVEAAVAQYDMEEKKALRSKWGHDDDRGHVIAWLCEQFVEGPNQLEE